MIYQENILHFINEDYDEEMPEELDEGEEGEMEDEEGEEE